MSSAFVWMSVSFPATAVANESARSFNNPSAVIARASSASMFSCNVSAASVNCPNDARWFAAVASAAETLPETVTLPVTPTLAPSVVSPETLRVPLTSALPLMSALPSAVKASMVVAPSTFKPSNSVKPSTSRVEPAVTAPSKLLVWYTDKSVAFNWLIVPAGEEMFDSTVKFWIAASSTSISWASIASKEAVEAIKCPASSAVYGASKDTVLPLSSK